MKILFVQIIVFAVVLLYGVEIAADSWRELSTFRMTGIPYEPIEQTVVRGKLICVCQSNGCVYMSRDGGLHFNLVHPSVLNVQHPRVQFISEQTGYWVGTVKTDSQTLCSLEITRDGGSTWTPIYQDLSGSTFHCALSTYDVEYLALTVMKHDSAWLLVSRDSGGTWASMSIPCRLPRAVYCSKDSVVVASYEGKFVVCSLVSNSFVEGLCPSMVNCYYCKRATDTLVLAGSYELVTSTDAGKSWSVRSIDWSSGHCAFVSGAVGFIGGTASIFSTSNSGVDWTKSVLKWNSRNIFVAGVACDTSGRPEVYTVVGYSDTDSVVVFKREFSTSVDSPTDNRQFDRFNIVRTDDGLFVVNGDSLESLFLIDGVGRVLSTNDYVVHRHDHRSYELRSNFVLPKECYVVVVAKGRTALYPWWMLSD